MGFSSFHATCLIICLLFACSGAENQANRPTRHDGARQVTVEDFQAILDSSDVSGAILVYDSRNNIFYSNDFERCRVGHLPASTFKVPNSIIALEAGVMHSDSTLIPWDGQPRRLKAWERDLYFRDAFHVSCVPCYQEIAREIGVAHMREYLEKLNYGEMLVDSSNIDVFWLEGESKIDQFQQIDFLRRFYHSELPVSAGTQEIMRRLMVIEENSGYKLSGKTGWSVRNGNNNGWFVGYLEKGTDVWFFATNIDPQKEFDMEMFPMIRKEITMKALTAIGSITG